MRALTIALCALVFAGPGVEQVRAQQPFARDLNLYVGTDPGGGYDLNARVLARHMGQHLPGSPNIVIQNMPGAGGLKAANYIFNNAARDGTSFGIAGPTVLLDPLLGGKGGQFDPRKFTFIGSTANEVSTCIAWHSARVQTMEALLRDELLVAGTGPMSVSGLFPRVMNALIGTHLKVIQGYKSSAEALLAMEKGENEGFCGLGWININARADWRAAKSITVIVQLGLRKHPEHPDVPLVMDYAKTELDRQVLELTFAPQFYARPFFAPPGVPAERAAALRAGFDATLKDPQYLAEAKKQGLEPELVTALQIEDLINRFYALPPAVIKRAKTVMAP